MVSAATLAGMMSYGTTSITAPSNVRDHTTRLLKHLKYPIRSKILKGKDRKDFEVSKIKIDVLKSDLVSKLN